MVSCPGFHGNRLLASLSSEIQSRLSSNLKLYEAEVEEVLYGPGSHSHEWVYFPINALVSHVYIIEDGRSAEISIVGREGMLGIGFFLGGEALHSQAIVQQAGSLCAMPSRLLKEEFARNAEVRDLLLRYVQLLLVQTAQTAVCNRYHRVEQQLCRWLLVALDRLPGNEIQMTQELIAGMLGVRREGVTECAGRLQRKGAIKYSRGHIHVADRELLEELTCECYGVVEAERQRLMTTPRLSEAV